MMRHFLRRWTWQMAWRDTRASRRRLLLFSTSIVMGIAALVAIRSFAVSAERAIDEQSRLLLGADLAVTSRRALTQEDETLLSSLGGEQAREIDFSAMLYFPKRAPNDGEPGLRLVQVRASSKNFPFYGRFEAEPDDAVRAFRAGAGVILEPSLLHQFNAKIGDPVRLGELTTTIAGTIKRAPGESAALAALAPRIYISTNLLPQTGLLRDGSLARYRAYFKFPEGTNVRAMMENVRLELQEHRLNFHTVETRKADLGRSVDDVSNYLHLAALIALLLGGIGVASGIHVHVKSKLETAAVLRCLGCAVGQTFAIYLCQALLVGLVGALIGAAAGILLQHALPIVLAGFFPVKIAVATEWRGVALAIAQGLASSILFALLPLLDVRRVSPLAAIRANYQPARPLRHDWTVWLIYAVMTAVVVLFCVQHSRGWRQGLQFAGGLAVAFLVLASVARLTVWMARRSSFRSLPYVWRQGFANLHRPQNRTTLLVLSLGLGTFLILSIFLVQNSLIKELVTARGVNAPNLAMFDIQSDQREGVLEILRSNNVPVLDHAPVVTMRLSAIKGQQIEKILAQTNRTIPDWALRREYRSTYTDMLRLGEKLLGGHWPVKSTNEATTPISIEKGIAQELGVGLGDAITFDVQGVPLETRVVAIREVDWRRVQPNFFIVFPPAALQEAPASHIVTARVSSSQQSAQVQRGIVEAFPNVSAIDLMLILQTLDSVFSRISFAVQFMASFTIGTGLLVLIGTILTGRYQRIRESVLLRSLGASRWQVLQVLLAEHLALGVLSVCVGALLASAAGWGLARFVFRVHFVPSLTAIVCAIIFVPALSVAVGLLASRGILNHPPLAVLRSE